jgi:DNA-binding response OmpR family regulator
MRILCVEDTLKLAASLKRGLEQEGYAVDVLHDGLDAEKRLMLSHADYDMVLLDLTIPGKDGITLCKEIRARGLTLPVLMLTAKDTVDDKILGLDSGADDYLIKPFVFEELLSRIRALSRRPRVAHAPELTIGTLTLHSATQKIYASGEEIDLTLKEFRILEFFMQHPNEVLSRQRIIDHLWDFSFNPLSRVMDVHINNLRNKLDTKGYGTSIQTVRGVGYRLSA